jgi:GNAT superfamily N-acetyltransferase
VDISIACAVEDQMGKVFVDSVENPQAFMIEQDQFFCYFAGDLTSDGGRDFLSKTPHGRLLMAGSQGWQEGLQAVFGEQLKPITRYLFSSETLSASHLKSLAASNPHTANVRRIDVALASGDTPYLQINAFDSADDFVQRGIGFGLVKDDKMIGGAYASLVCGDAIEVSIVVDPEHRRLGVATALSCQLLLWCLENHVSPHWDAANPESCKLAEKLGYRAEGEYTAYFLR